MGFLAPDITSPVKLALSATEAKREAIGRTMGLAGTLVGLVGAVMVLTSNPALRAALGRGGDVDMTVSPAQAKREALGKSLALIGMAVGLSGTALTVTADPKTMARLPAFVQQHPTAVAAGIGVLLAGGAVLLIRAQNQSFVGKRYQAA